MTVENKTGAQVALERAEAKVKARSQLSDLEKVLFELTSWRDVFTYNIPVTDVDRARFSQHLARGRDILGMVGMYDLTEVIHGLQLLVDNTSKLLEHDDV